MMSGNPKVLSIDEVQRRRDQPEDQRWPWSPSKPIESVDQIHQWRKHAEAGHWWLIDETFLSREEREVLLTLLTGKVPTREWGDGLKTFKDFIHPSEAATVEEAGAAQLARLLKKRKNSEEKTSVHSMIRPFTDPFVEAVQAAKDVLQKHGFVYEGLASTYLYWHPASKTWKRLGRSRAKLINMWSQKMRPFNDDFFKNGYDQLPQEELTEKLLEWQSWMNRFPWRQNVTLQRLMADDSINPNTSLWHACNILKAYESTLFSRYVQPFSPPKPSGSTFSSSEQFSYAHMCDAYQSALRIGTAYEAMKNKSVERDAIRGIDQLKFASEGGRATATKGTERREKILKVMYDLMAKKGWKKYEYGPSWAASLAFERKHGTSPGANRALWNRYARKKWPELKWL